MTCASESISSMAEKELLSDEVEADIFFVIVPAITLISRNVTLKVNEKQRRRLFTTAGPQKQALLYSMLPSIRTVPVSGHLKQKLNF